MTEWPHPERCPGEDCRGQFFLLRHYGIICTIRLQQLTNGSMTKVLELSKQAEIERMEGLGLS